MNDLTLVQRMRAGGKMNPSGSHPYEDILDEAADEIDRLQSRNELLEAVVEAAKKWERDENRTDETEHNLIMAVQALAAVEDKT